MYNFILLLGSALDLNPQDNELAYNMGGLIATLAIWSGIVFGLILMVRGAARYHKLIQMVSEDDDSGALDKLHEVAKVNRDVVILELEEAERIYKKAGEEITFE